MSSNYNTSTPGIGKMLEKRKVKRRTSVYYLEVFEEETKSFVGRLINITKDGMMLESQEPIEVKKGYRLSMDCQTASFVSRKLFLTQKVFGVKKKVILNHTKPGFTFKTWIQKLKKKSTD